MRLMKKINCDDLYKVILFLEKDVIVYKVEQGTFLRHIK